MSVSRKFSNYSTSSITHGSESATSSLTSTSEFGATPDNVRRSVPPELSRSGVSDKPQPPSGAHSTIEPRERVACRQLRQLGVLLWKDIYLFRIKRHYMATIMEFVFPLLILTTVRVVYAPSSALSSPLPGPSPLNESHLMTTDPNVNIVYLPLNNITNSMMDLAFPQLTKAKKIIGLNPSQKVDSFMATQSAVKLVVLFRNTAKHNLSYTLRFNYSQFDYTTDLAIDTPADPTFCSVMDALFKAHTIAHGLPHPDAQIRLFPLSLQHTSQQTTWNLATVYSVMRMLTVGIFIRHFAMRILKEKSIRLREFMRIMGMSDFTHWLSTVIGGCSVLFPIYLLCVFVMSIDIRGQTMYPKTQVSLIIFVMFIETVYSVVWITFATSFTENPEFGCLIIRRIWALTAIVSALRFIFGYLKATPLEKILVTIFLPPLGLQLNHRSISYWSYGPGARWSNLHLPAISGDVTLGVLLASMCASILFFSLITFYFNNVIPWQTGVPKHPLYLFQPSYWCSASVEDISEVEQPAGKYVEKQGTRGQPTVLAKSLSKTFWCGKEVIRNVNLRIHQDEISVILGHNGAGKSTLINILTGLFPPTSGDLLINGHSLRTNTAMAREHIGMCPQHNVLFDDLTVKDHMQFFGRLKGASWQAIKEDAAFLLPLFELEDKVDVLSKNLSMGMKRKLSMVNAIVGGSSVLILDEPTAGMDTEARQKMWQVIQEVRKGRSILMTTHYMDDADVLADRVSFLVNGKIECAGSPLFLKRVFETGYKVSLSKASQLSDVSAGLSLARECVGNEATLEINLNLEYIISIGYPSMSKMIKLLKSLEEKKADLKIASFGVALSSMEDVFLKVSRHMGEEGEEKSMVSSSIDSPAISFDPLTGSELTKSQFLALMAKRFDTAKRYWWVVIIMLCVTVLLSFSSFLSMYRSTVAPKLSIKYDLGSPPLITLKPAGFVVQSPGRITELFLKYLKSRSIIVKKLPQDSSPDIMDNMDFGKRRGKLMIGARMDGSTLRVWYSRFPYHIMPTALAAGQTVLLRNMSQNNKALVQVTNSPLTGGHVMKTISNIFDKGSDLMHVHKDSVFAFGMVLVFGHTLLLAMFVINEVNEKTSKARLIQLMTGVSPSLYLLANFLFDFSVYSLCSIIFAAVVYLQNTAIRNYTDLIWTLILLFELHGFSMLPFIYFLCKFPRDPNVAFKVLMLLCNIIGVFGAVAISYSRIINIYNPPLLTAIDWIVHVLHVIPCFPLFYGMSNIHFNGIMKNKCGDVIKNPVLAKYQCNLIIPKWLNPCCSHCATASGTKLCYVRRSVFSFDLYFGTGTSIVAMVLSGIFWFGLIVLLDSCLLRRILRKKAEGSVKDDDVLRRIVDPDVLDERLLVEKSVQTGERKDAAMTAYGLRKRFGKLRAVDGISFRVKDECFGLLGVNGAGKTTAFSLLTGEVHPDGGDAFINEYNLVSDREQFLAQVGYCPQFDPIIPTMTGREMIRLMCRLRGAPPDTVEDVVNAVIEYCDLIKFADVRCANYSGGTKRKLSLALAVCGCPKVILLDEPTAGIDPEARRKIWSLLMKARKLGSAIVLCSHSMEECAALCDRITIMVRGTLRCIGSSQHLKSRFINGFVILIKLKTQSDSASVVTKISEEMERMFPLKNHLVSNHLQLLHYRISDSTILWSDVFEAVTKMSDKFQFEDIVVSEITLEEIFLKFASEQKELEAPV